jgi:outer membrane protein
MKNSFLTVIAVIVIAFLAGKVDAQSNLKVAHINTQDLLAAMPESDSAQAKLQKKAKELQDQLEQMQVEFNKKYQEYNQKASTYSDIIKQTKETELQEMNQRIQQFQQNAEQSMQKERSDTFKPVLDKANNAISDVAKENKITYVLDASTGILLFKSDDSIDLLPLVKKKLGLK